MSKKIEDYLHLYLGCEVYDSNPKDEKFRCYIITAKELAYYANHLHTIKPHLRPLSSMTEEEKIEITRDYVYSHVKFSSRESIMSCFDQDRYTRKKNTLACEFYVDETIWLLSHHFDLFGLIDAGLAIDKTKINQP